MFEYDFVQLKLVDRLSPKPRLERGYLEVIHQRAAEGWRFIQLFRGGSQDELIFERKISDPGSDRKNE